MAGAGYRIADGYLEVTADTDKADRQLLKFFRSTDGRLRDMRGRFVSEGELAGSGFSKGVKKGAGKKGDSWFDEFKKGFGKVAGIAQTAGGAVGKAFFSGFTAKLIGGLGALPGIVSAATAAVQGAMQIGGAVGALAPAAIGAAVLGMATLKTAFSGMGDALKAGLAGDMDKFAEATKNMAPAMKTVVGEIVKLNPLLKDLKATVQQSFWAPMVGDVSALGQTYLPMLRNVMMEIAGSFGTAFGQIMTFLNAGPTAAGLGAAFRDIAAALGNVAAGLPGIVQGLVTLFTVGADFLPNLTGGFDQLTQKFAAWMAMLADTGQLQAFISGGLQLIGDLATGLGDILGILRSIGAAVPNGGGLFAALGQLLSLVNQFFASFQGQEILTTFFDKLQAIGQIVIQLVTAALPGLAILSGALVTGLQALLPAAQPVGDALSTIFSALAPLLPVIGQLAALLLTGAADGLKFLATALGPVIALFSDLASSVLPMLMPVLTTLMTSVMPIAVNWFMALADAIRPIIPPLLEVAQAFIDQLLPVLVTLAPQMEPVREAVLEMVKAFVPLIMQIMPGLMANIPVVIKIFTILIDIFAIAIPWITKFVGYFTTFFEIMQTVTPIIGGVIAFFLQLPQAIADFVSGAWDAIVNFFTGLIDWFAALPGRIWEWLSQLPTVIGDAISQMQERGLYMIGFFIGSVVKFFMDLPGQIWAFLSSLPSMIGNAFSSAWEWAKSATSTAISAVISFVSSLPTRAANILGGLWGAISGAVSSAWNSLKNAASSAIDATVQFVKDLPGKVKSVFSDAGSWLLDAGKNIIQGLANGIQDKLSWAIDKAKSAASAIAKGFKDALGIGSPSKVMAMDVGRWIPPGIQQGIQAAMPALTGYVEGAARGIATAAAGPVVSVAAPNVSVGGATAILMVDGEEIAAKIITPDRVAAATAEGSRKRSYLNTGRPAVVGGAAA